MSFMFSSAKLSTVNYDALLIGWSSQSLLSDVIFNAGSSTYSNAAQGSRDVLTNSFNWIINDGGVEAQ
jgi:hypothetical protein